MPGKERLIPNPEKEELALLFLAKAEQDLAALHHLVSIPGIADEIIGFHAQQTAEKALKALLVWHDVLFRRTHDLTELLDLLTDHGVKIPDPIKGIDFLTPFAVEMRHEVFPGQEPPLDRKYVVKLVQEAIEWSKGLIGQA